MVDPGMDSEVAMAMVLADYRLKPVAVVLTHGHLDHMFAVAPLSRAHLAPCWVHPGDRPLLSDPLLAMPPETGRMLAQLAPEHSGFTEPYEVRELTDGSVITAAGIQLVASHAPGHTPGSTMFLTGPEENILLSGDVLFADSIGRTDLPGGNHQVMLDTLRRKVLPLADGVTVLPGHGPTTTIGAERANNPYLRQLSESRW